eukprot:11936682-Heterocapsa_arctica.AAC.1
MIGLNDWPCLVKDVRRSDPLGLLEGLDLFKGPLGWDQPSQPEAWPLLVLFQSPGLEHLGLLVDDR